MTTFSNIFSFYGLDFQEFARSCLNSNLSVFSNVNVNLRMKIKIERWKAEEKKTHIILTKDVRWNFTDLLLNDIYKV